MTFDEWWNEQPTRFVAAGFKDDAREIWVASAQAEREACAKVCEEKGMIETARRIRMRSNAIELGENWYDAEIAPKLLELADRCRERGMAMVATVEYSPGERGSTMALPDGTGLAMQMLRLCANTGENVDGYMIALRKFCDANGINTGASIFMRGPNACGEQRATEDN